MDPARPAAPGLTMSASQQRRDLGFTPPAPPGFQLAGHRAGCRRAAVSARRGSGPACGRQRRRRDRAADHRVGARARRGGPRRCRSRATAVGGRARNADPDRGVRRRRRNSGLHLSRPDTGRARCGFAMISDWGLLARFVLALTVVLALIAAATWAARRYMGSAMMAGLTGRRRLAVIESTMLDGKSRLVLVRRDSTEHLLVLGP